MPYKAHQYYAHRTKQGGCHRVGTRPVTTSTQQGWYHRLRHSARAVQQPREGLMRLVREGGRSLALDEFCDPRGDLG
ncbi:hypothetical protein GCM10010274_43970 [Streptomyces lavendofoliae]|uniref:Uncharacterized protein n=1 Tax=Streptomyces lavendofoliae TaxID=67314 RepID=A0A918I0B1_9ACTN|nr:hypothetical protein GCM10010274_43970 [Streptomyces lavendofoliae]